MVQAKINQTVDLKAYIGGYFCMSLLVGEEYLQVTGQELVAKVLAVEILPRDKLVKLHLRCTANRSGLIRSTRSGTKHYTARQLTYREF